MKGQFFVLSIIIIIAIIMELFSAFRPVPGNFNIIYDKEISAMSEAQWATLNNLTGMKNYMDFMKREGIKVVLITCKNHTLSAFSSLPGPSRLYIRGVGLGANEQSLDFYTNVSTHVSGNITIAIISGNYYASIHADANKNFTAAFAFSKNMAIKSFILEGSNN